MTIGRPVLLLFALVPYVLGVAAFFLFALYAWHAWGFEPVALPVPTPVPATPSVGSEVASYATGGGAVGGLAIGSWLARAVSKFFSDIRDHFKAEEAALGKVVKLLEKHEARIEFNVRVEEELARRDSNPISLEGRR